MVLSGTLPPAPSKNSTATTDFGGDALVPTRYADSKKHINCMMSFRNISVIWRRIIQEYLLRPFTGSFRIMAVYKNNAISQSTINRYINLLAYVSGFLRNWTGQAVIMSWTSGFHYQCSQSHRCNGSRRRIYNYLERGRYLHEYHLKYW